MFDDIDATVACIHMGFGYVLGSANITVIRTTTAKSQTTTANIAKRDVTSQHIAEMSLCFEVTSSFVMSAVLVLQLCCCRPYKVL